VDGEVQRARLGNILPWVGAVCALVVFHSLRSAWILLKEHSKDNLGKIHKSSILLPSGANAEFTERQEEIPFYRPGVLVSASLLACLSVLLFYVVWKNGKPETVTSTITKDDGFTILIPIDTASRNWPIPLDENPEDTHGKFYRTLTFSITDRDSDKTSGYLMLQQDQLFSEEERPKFLGKLILMYVFESVFSMTRESYGVELRGGKVTPLENKSVIPPDVVSSPTDYVVADLSKRQFLNSEIEVLLKNFPLHMPKGTSITFSEQVQRKATVYIMRMERPGFFKFDLTVRPVGNSDEGVLPDKFQTQASKTVKTYDLIVGMESVVQATTKDGFEPDKYVAWTQDTFSELRRRMTF